MTFQRLTSSNCSIKNGGLPFVNCSSHVVATCVFSNCTQIWTSSDPILENISNTIEYQEFNGGVDEEFEVFRERSRFWIQRVLVPMILIIGLIGNTVTIVIMTRRRMRSSTNNYLAALAIFDMMYLICVFGLSLFHYPGIQDPRYVVYWHIRPFVIMLTDACSNTSVWLTVTFTIERYIAVSHPIKGKIYCTESRAKKVIVFVSLICFFLTLPTPFEWTVIEITDDETNETTISMDFSDFGNNNLYKTVYYTMTAILFVFIPLFLLAIFNSFLIRSVHLSKIQRNTMTHLRESRDSLQQENKITVMLIAVVVLFFISQLPTAATLVYTSLHAVPPNTNKEALLQGLGNIFNFLVCINAAGNFVLYCLLSQKYRRTFLQTFCPCIKNKLVRLQSVYQRSAYSNVNDNSQLSRNTVVRRSNQSRADSKTLGTNGEGESKKHDFSDASSNKWRAEEGDSFSVLSRTNKQSHNFEEERSGKRKKLPSIFNNQWRKMLGQGERRTGNQEKTVTFQADNDSVILSSPEGVLSINVHSAV
ncbi:FMRFamide receptor-like [Limulus polyphemus]|uniref:FMRFamide receptor-like n=1 Tax=Limulus polyphemus TaxID=6850 RepID=A0ABM1B095_LIMPO|nr:FMRFamide receptor-like [Limulus polyphemus]